MIRTLVLAIALFAAQLVAANDDPFPRLGGLMIGGHDYDNPAVQAEMARYRVAVVGTWPGWNNSKRSLEEVARNVKRINPQTLIFQYINSMEVSATDASVAPYYGKVNAEGWWLVAPGSSAPILSQYGVQTGKAVYQINNTNYTAESEWHARWAIDVYLKPNPSLDGFFEDNVFYQPRVSGDWNGDGVKDSPATAYKWLQEGYRARFALLHKLMPGKYVIGNVADLGKKAAEISTLQDALDGGVMEGILGSNYSPEGLAGGWADMMRHYRKTMAVLHEPRFGLFHMQGDKADLQSFRYGFASCLMDDGYFTYTDKVKGYSGSPWFPEYDAKLGAAIAAPALSAWQGGVFRRDFEGGIALVNPKGNGPITIFLGEDFKRIDGQTVRSVALADRDGVILLRVKPKSIPGAPGLALN